MPGTSRHTEGVVLLHGGSAISSIAPTMMFCGSVGFCAMLGSTVLLVANGPAKALFTWTLLTLGGDAACAKCGTNATAAMRTSISHPACGNRKVCLFLIPTSCVSRDLACGNHKNSSSPRRSEKKDATYNAKRGVSHLIVYMSRALEASRFSCHQFDTTAVAGGGPWPDP